jgi:pimeloyl-ACP methyl ester carboxylesterase
MAAMSADLRFAKHCLPSGLCLNVAEKGLPDGQVILLLHGYADSWFSYSRILPLLPAGVRAVVPDQRGHGKSDRPADGYAPDGFSEDAIQLLDTLDIESAVVVGHSMGSFIARRIAVKAPERVKGLVLIGSAATARNEATRQLLEEVNRLADPVEADFVRAFQSSTIHRPVPADFFEQIVAESLKVPAQVWKAALSGLLTADPRADFALIRCPVLILGGDRDGVFARAEQEHLAACIPGATLKISRDIGHDPQWEAPDDVVFDLLAFLQSPKTG